MTFSHMSLMITLSFIKIEKKKVLILLLVYLEPLKYIL